MARTLIAMFAASLLTSMAACSSGDDVADELGDSLEPERDFVEEPSDDPPSPR